MAYVTEEIHDVSTDVRIMPELNEQRKDGTLCDVTLEVEGRNFHAHKAVLAAASQYFKVMFCGSFRERNENVVNLKDAVSPDGLEVILDTIYTAELKLTTDNVVDVILAADFLQIEKVTTLCEDFIRKRVSDETCVEYYQVCKKLSMDATAAVAFERLTSFFSAQPNFKNLDYECLIDIVSHPNVRLWKGEIELFRAACTWLEDNEVTEEEADTLLTDQNIIDYRRIRKSFLQKEVAKHELVNNDTRREAVQNAIKFHKNLYAQPILLSSSSMIDTGFLYRTGLFIKQIRRKDGTLLLKPLLVFDRPMQHFEIILNLEPEKICCIMHGKYFVFVFGSNTETKTNVMSRYNVTLRTWLKLKAPPSQLLKVQNVMMACSLKTVYVVGGVDHETGKRLNSCYAYNIEKNSWTALPAMPGRLSSAGICTHQGKEMVYVAGGDTGTLSNERKVNTLYVYKQRYKKWYRMAEMKLKRSKFSLLDTPKYLLAVCGVEPDAALKFSPVEEYNIAANQWTSLQIGPCKYKLYKELPSCFIDGSILISNFANSKTRCAEEYLFEWEPTKSFKFLTMRHPVRRHVFGSTVMRK